MVTATIVWVLMVQTVAPGKPIHNHALGIFPTEAACKAGGAKIAKPATYYCERRISRSHVLTCGNGCACLYEAVSEEFWSSRGSWRVATLPLLSQRVMALSGSWSTSAWYSVRAMASRRSETEIGVALRPCQDCVVGGALDALPAKAGSASAAAINLPLPGRREPPRRPASGYDEPEILNYSNAITTSHDR